MNIAINEAAGGVSAFGYTAILVVGVALVAGLIWAFRLGFRVRRRESAPPRPEEQPTRPVSGPVQEERQAREWDEVPRATDGSERLTPHQLNPTGTKRAADQSRPRWEPGSSGSFGGGGGGRT
ncbi:DUF6479 family protein [Streptomyces sp. NPDC004542]|uniref:DUF6479 family protein n=1 Tax=Streptomyces sp. NPDC004542 TaxID=3154281 RepID=UPI0033B51F07